MPKDKSAPQYFELAYTSVKRGASVSSLSERKLAWPLKTGKTVAAAWRKHMTFTMRLDRPKDVTLTDYIPNVENLLLASPRLIAFLREQKLPEVEFLPVTLLDTKGGVASKDYAIVNCHHVVDCVDQERSAFKWDGLDDPWMVVERIELRADALGADDRLVRPKFVPGKAFYRADFRDTLLAQRFTGLGFSREVFGDFDVYE